MTRIDSFATEAELVQAFCAWNEGRGKFKWVIYHETCGWDLLAVCPETGMQVGIEAKLSLNAKVISQALPAARWSETDGPDYRAVLVPEKGCQNHIRPICDALGLTVISIWGHVSPAYGNRPEQTSWQCSPWQWPDEGSIYSSGWHNWLPAEREKLPDYLPDVQGGHAAPVMLTPWKIKAIKLMIWLERHGCVTRADMKALQISPTRWTDGFNGFLSPGSNGGYVRNGRTPDLRAQHPTNYAQIEADIDVWSKDLPRRVTDAPADLFASREGLAAAPI